MLPTYAHVRDRLAPGDVLLFAGRGLVSRVIQFAQHVLGDDDADPTWSHVGLVYWAGPMCCVLEATTLTTVADLFAGAPVRGVQVVPLSRRLATYDGIVAWRQLRPSVGNVDRLHTFRLEVCHQPYEQNLRALWAALYDGVLGGEAAPRMAGDGRSWFCSELVAAAYIALGLLPAEPAPTEYTPADFASGGKVDQRCRPRGFQLAAPVLLRPWAKTPPRS